MITKTDLQTISDLVNDRVISNVTLDTERKTSLVALAIENRKAAAMERIADALTALAGKDA